MSNSKGQIQYESSVALWYYIMMLSIFEGNYRKHFSVLKEKGKTESQSRREKPTTTKKQKKPWETGK